ncbi:RDD family protein [Pontibacter rugosus]|uniref:RDD family protein n=1 Tax=Pontibacter rugosus TaxID=1745966 RepID=A0ABW3SM75_9BACT
MQATYTQTNTKSELANPGPRLIAFSLDVLLLITLVGLADYFTFSTDEKALLLKPERLLHLLLSWLYFAGAETCSCQGTIGKFLLNLRVTATSGQRLSFKAASIRFFAKPATAFITMVRFLVGAPNDTRRTLHDRLANAQVVRR